jgi:hypothetical protein
MLASSHRVIGLSILSVLSQDHLRQASVVRRRPAKQGLGAVLQVQSLPGCYPYMP